jgi:dTDP-4-dehydrorhamnose 3,5-epimerase
MKATPTAIPEVVLFEPRIFGDARGHFFESYNRQTMRSLGLDVEFVQDNQSLSAKGVLRGLHYQIQQPQGKLVRANKGEIFDVAVDLRRSSPTFGRWVGERLSEDNHYMLWVPPGFAHGFVVLSETAEMVYKVTDYYAPQWDRSLRWDDPDLGIDWPIVGTPTLSEKDRAAKPFHGADLFD